MHKVGELYLKNLYKYSEYLIYNSKNNNNNLKNLKFSHNIYIL